MSSGMAIPKRAWTHAFSSAFGASRSTHTGRTWASASELSISSWTSRPLTSVKTLSMGHGSSSAAAQGAGGGPANLLTPCATAARRAMVGWSERSPRVTLVQTRLRTKTINYGTTHAVEKVSALPHAAAADRYFRRTPNRTHRAADGLWSRPLGGDRPCAARPPSATRLLLIPCTTVTLLKGGLDEPDDQRTPPRSHRRTA